VWQARATVRVKTRYFEKLKTNISTGRIQRNFIHESVWIQGVFYFFDWWRIPKNSRNIQVFLDTKYRMFGQAVKKIYDCFALFSLKITFLFRCLHFVPLCDANRAEASRLPSPIPLPPALLRPAVTLVFPDPPCKV
jgi:hypothetical protein